MFEFNVKVLLSSQTLGYYVITWEHEVYHWILKCQKLINL